MPLAPGSRLGPYEIVSPLGAGGMGEVWRARDDRVGREVAIKVVRERFSDRFEREARAVAALNHPNLCTLYDVGPEYLVMELIEGETLRSRLTAGAIPLRHALDWARQLAQGLAAAHAQGIVHRDLKPENIMLTASRRLKILDFGLAKAAAVAASGDAETLGATALTAATSAGAVLGTAGYMAPEQVRGEAATPASDIFAFGAILYEMLSGRRAFQAPTAVELMTAILREEPVEITLPSAVGRAPAPLPLTLDRIVRRCLEKAPAERFQSAADLDFALSALADASSITLAAGATAAAARRRRRRFPALGGYIVAVAATAAVSAVFMLDRQPLAIPATAIRPLVLDSPLQGAVWSPTGDALALASPDGPNAPSQLFLERLGSPPELLTRSQGGLPAAGAGGDQDGVVPLGWSADGRSIIYAQNEVTAPTVWSVAAVGGAPRLLDDLGHPSGGAYAMAWHGDALAALIEQPDGTLGVGYSQPAGTPLRWYRPDPFAVRAIGDYVTLAFSPDGRQLLLSVPDAAGPVRTWLLPFPPDPAHPPHQILANLPPHAYSPKFSWTPDGRHLLLATYNGAASSLWEADPSTSRMRKLAATPNLY